AVDEFVDHYTLIDNIDREFVLYPESSLSQYQIVGITDTHPAALGFKDLLRENELVAGSYTSPVDNGDIGRRCRRLPNLNTPISVDVYQRSVNMTAHRIGGHLVLFDKLAHRRQF